jgi:hypothetical protein
LTAPSSAIAWVSRVISPCSVAGLGARSASAASFASSAFASASWFAYCSKLSCAACS